MNTANTARRAKRLNLARQAARLHRIRLTAAPAASEEADTTSPDATTVPVQNRFAWLAKTRPILAGARSRLPRRRESKKDTLADWQSWSRFRLWRRTRPFWGSVWMIVAALILLAFPISLLQFAFLVNTLWASLLIGGLLLVMGLIQLFLPSYAVITGSVGMVLSLVSFVTNTFGGLALGMLLGIIGCALSIAWRPVPRSRLVSTSSSTHA
jgi:hypothetical protein